MSWFVQGNSNSLATVDLAAGYVGLEEFNLPIVVGLLFLATYAGPIYWVLSLMVHLTKHMDHALSPVDRSVQFKIQLYYTLYAFCLAA